MKKHLKYIEMKKEHIEEVLKLWTSTNGIYLHKNGEDSKEGIILFLNRNPGFSFITLNNENKIVGALLCGHDGRRGFIHHLAVDKEYRKQGIANKLINLSIIKLKKEGIKKVALFVLKEQKNAQKFYKHNNWNKEDFVLLYSKII